MTPHEIGHYITRLKAAKTPGDMERIIADVVREHGASDPDQAARVILVAEIFIQRWSADN